MRQILGALTLGTMLATAAVAVRAADLGLPPLDPMRGAAVVAQADEPDIQQATPPYQDLHDENKDSVSNQ